MTNNEKPTVARGNNIMTKFCLQFHHAPSELKELVESLHLPTETWVVFIERAQPTVLANLSGDIRHFAFSTLGFTTAYPHLEGRGSWEFLKRHPQAMLWDVSRLTSDGLSQACISGIFDDTTAKLWKPSTARLKRKLHAGVTAIARDTGAQNFRKNHHYSEGALRLHQSGCEWLSLVGKKAPLLVPGDQTKSEKQ